MVDYKNKIKKSVILLFILVLIPSVYSATQQGITINGQVETTLICQCQQPGTCTYGCDCKPSSTICDSDPSSKCSQRYTIIGDNSPLSSNYCEQWSWNPIRCTGSSSDCPAPNCQNPDTRTTQITAGICARIKTGTCTGTTAGQIEYYNSQTQGPTQDTYVLSGTPSDAGTNYCKARDWHCSGTSSSESYTDTTVATCSQHQYTDETICKLVGSDQTRCKYYRGVSSIPSGIQAFLELNELNLIDFTQQFQKRDIGQKKVFIKKNNQNIASFDINPQNDFSDDFIQGQYDWANLRVDTNYGATEEFGKVLFNTIAVQKIPSIRKVYLPAKEGSGTVTKCPNAQSMSEISHECYGKQVITGLVEQEGFYVLDDYNGGAIEGSAYSLEVWDELDEGKENADKKITYANEAAIFFADYRDSGNTISNADCEIEITGTSIQEDMDPISGLYAVEISSISSPGQYDYEVTCQKSGAETLTSQGSINISLRPELDLQIKTLKDNYYKDQYSDYSETIGITDPPGENIRNIFQRFIDFFKNMISRTTNIFGQAGGIEIQEKTTPEEDQSYIRSRNTDAEIKINFSVEKADGSSKTDLYSGSNNLEQGTTDSQKLGLDTIWNDPLKADQFSTENKELGQYIVKVEAFDLNDELLKNATYPFVIGEKEFNLTIEAQTAEERYSDSQDVDLDASFIRNNEDFNIDAYLRARIQFYDGSQWIDESIILDDVDSSTLRTVNSGNSIQLDPLISWNTDNNQHGYGDYRIMIEIRTPNSPNPSYTTSYGEAIDYAEFNLIGSGSSLSIWATEDNRIDQEVNFYANYNDGTDPIAPDRGGECSITIDSQTQSMTYDTQSQQYIYQRTFSTEGNYDYDIICSGTGLVPRTESKTVEVQGNTPPTQPQLTITPLNPSADKNLTCQITGQSTDAETDPITYKFQWYKNSNLHWESDYTTSTAIKLTSQNTLKGEIWECRVIPYDGFEQGQYGSSEVTIVSSAPIADAGSDEVFDSYPVTVNFDATNSYDPDGDELTYTWSNGMSGPTPSKELTRGTHIITLTVDDGDSMDMDSLIIDVGDNSTIENIEDIESSTLENTRFSGSKSENSDITNSNIEYNSYIYYSEVSDSTIRNSNLNSSRKINSIVINSIVIDSDNENCTIRDMEERNAVCRNNYCSEGTLVYQGEEYNCPININEIYYPCGDGLCEGPETCGFTNDYPECIYDCGECAENQTVLAPACNDGLDNDNDSLVDYPADPGCLDEYTDDETDCYYDTDCPWEYVCINNTCIEEAEETEEDEKEIDVDIIVPSEGEETCYDGILNQDETDTDCGGSCKKCSSEKKCEANSDCESNICSDNICIEQEEPDIIQPIGIPEEESKFWPWFLVILGSLLLIGGTGSYIYGDPELTERFLEALHIRQKSPSSDFDAKLKKAYEFIKKDNYKEVYKLYTELYNLYPSLPEDEKAQAYSSITKLYNDMRNIKNAGQ